MLDQLRRSDQPPRPLLQCGQPNTHREHGRKHNIQSGILYKESAQRIVDAVRQAICGDYVRKMGPSFANGTKLALLSFFR